MKWSILGPVQVIADHAPVPIERPQQRAILAYLLLNANRVVTIRQLVAALWGGRAPTTANNQIYTCMCHIRRALRDARAHGLLTTRSSGYCLAVADEDLDLTRFTEQVKTASAYATKGETAMAAHHYHRALDCWQGEALTGAVAAFVEPAAQALHERRLTVDEDLTDVELHLRRHASLVPRLQELVNANPLRERLVSQLMLALYRSGRQAESLSAFQRLRRQLNDMYGLDPGHAITQLHEKVVRADPDLHNKHP